MTRVLVWKELREQWTSAAAVLALGLVTLGIVVATHSPYGVPEETGFAVLMCIAWVSGLVAGIQPIAGEREGGTLTWLDALPVTRRRLWWSKSVAAAAIVGTVTTVMFAATLSAVRLAASETVADPLLPLALTALNGLGCGLLGSATARTALGAFGWAVVAQLLLAAVFTVVVVPMRLAGQSLIRDLLEVVLATLIGVLPLFLSARRFGRLDRLRATAVRRTAGPASDWRAVAWLTWRQCRVVAWAVLGAGLVLAVVVPLLAPHLWPAIGLVLGVATGIGTFGSDQAGMAHRFLGDRRVPIGRVWLVKQAVRFAPVAILLAAYFLIGQLRVFALQVNDVGHSREFQIEQLRQHYDPSLVLLGPILGYALGQFAGLVARKEAVGAVIAIVTAAGVGVLWLPSLTVGGVHLWQWVGPPLLLVAATRLAIWPWASGRLGSWRPALGLIAAVVLAAAGTAAGVAYRLVEAPVRAEPFDVAAFEARLPTPEQNAAGRAINRAIARYRAHLARVNAELGEKQAAGYEDWKFMGQVQDALTAGQWPGDSAELDRWLDAVLQDRWLDELRQAVKLPLGMVAAGGTSHYASDYATVRQGTSAGTFILARGLRRTARDEIEPAFQDLELVLDYCRHLRSKTGDVQFLSAAQLECQVTDLLPSWAVRAADRPELVRRAIDKLRAHEAGLPPVSDTVKMDYLAARDYEQDRRFVTRLPRETVEEWLYQAALAVPWERWRSRAILDTWFAGLLRTAETSYPDALRRIWAARDDSERVWVLDGWTPPAGDVTSARAARRRMWDLLRSSPWASGPAFGGPNLFAEEARTRTKLRATQLQLALILFQVRSGKPAAELAALVPDTFPALPADPFGDGPFRYRVSGGERVVWVRRAGDSTGRDIAADEGILWSLGPDLEDGGGRVNDAATWRFPGWQPGADILFVVPVVRRP